MMMELRTKVKIASTANVSHWKVRRLDEKPQIIDVRKSLAESTDKVVAIGASTGGMFLIGYALKLGADETRVGVLLPAGRAGALANVTLTLMGRTVVNLNRNEVVNLVLQPELASVEAHQMPGRHSVRKATSGIPPFVQAKNSLPCTLMASTDCLPPIVRHTSGPSISPYRASACTRISESHCDCKGKPRTVALCSCIGM